MNLCEHQTIGKEKSELAFPSEGGQGIQVPYQMLSSVGSLQGKK